MNLATLSSFDTASNGPFFLYLIDKTLLLTARSIGRLFSRVKGYYSSKIRCCDTVGRGMRTGGSPF